MNSEMLAAKGRLAELERKKAHLESEAAGLITLIRSLLNPWEEDVTRLRIPDATSAMERLHTLYGELKTLKAQIQKLEEIFDFG